MNTVKKDIKRLVKRLFRTKYSSNKHQCDKKTTFDSLKSLINATICELEYRRDNLQYMFFEEMQYGKNPANEIKEYAIALACEAIQVAAMAEKVIVSERKRNEKEICD